MSEILLYTSQYSKTKLLDVTLENCKSSCSVIPNNYSVRGNKGEIGKIENIKALEILVKDLRTNTN